MSEAANTRGIVTCMARASYATLFSPRSYQDNPKNAPRYSVAILVPPEDVLRKVAAELKMDADQLVADRKRFLGEMNAAVNAITEKHFDGNKPKKITIQKAEDAGKGECYEPGWICIRASSGADAKPTVLLNKRDGSSGKFLPCPQEDFYSGCWMRASIDIYPYNNAEGISVGLNHVQKLADGDRLDSRVSAEDAFGDVDFAGGGAASSDDIFN